MPVTPKDPLRETAELLFRQASPGWIRDGRPTSQLFRPTAKDHGLLSVDRESVVGSAVASRERFLARGFQSHSTWGVTVGEVNAIPLEAYSDPTRLNDAHALLDMSHLSEREQRSVGERLRNAAEQRGQLAPNNVLSSPERCDRLMDPLASTAMSQALPTLSPDLHLAHSPLQEEKHQKGMTNTKGKTASPRSRGRR